MDKMKNNNLPKPNLGIDTSAKFYLAVAKRWDDVALLTFVYTLYLKQDKNGAYPMQTHQSTSAFDNETHANIFYRTIKDIVQCNLQSAFGGMVADYCEGAIREFKQATR